MHELSKVLSPTSDANVDAIEWHAIVKPTQLGRSLLSTHLCVPDGAPWSQRLHPFHLCVHASSPSGTLESPCPLCLRATCRMRAIILDSLEVLQLSQFFLNRTYVWRFGQNYLENMLMWTVPQPHHLPLQGDGHSVPRVRTLQGWEDSPQLGQDPYLCLFCFFILICIQSSCFPLCVFSLGIYHQA
jgi:hypothetical protein